MGPIIFSACEVPRAMEYANDARICRRCGSATVDVPPSEVTIASGSGWGVSTRTVTLCPDCEWSFNDWLSMPAIAAQLGPCGATGGGGVGSSVPA